MLSHGVKLMPLLTWPKKDSHLRRVIMDLSWAHHLDISVNAYTPKDMGTYKMKLPTANDLISLTKETDKGCFLISCDISRAYRQLRRDPVIGPWCAYNFRGATSWTLA